MGIKQLYNDNLRKLPNEYRDVSVMRKRTIFAGDFIDNRRPSELYVQILSLLMYLWENANCLFLIKAQVTR